MASKSYDFALCKQFPSTRSAIISECSPPTRIDILVITEIWHETTATVAEFPPLPYAQYISAEITNSCLSTYFAFLAIQDNTIPDLFYRNVGDFNSHLDIPLSITGSFNDILAYSYWSKILICQHVYMTTGLTVWPPHWHRWLGCLYNPCRGHISRVLPTSQQNWYRCINDRKK